MIYRLSEIYIIVYDEALYVVCHSAVHCRTLLGSVGDDVLHNVHCPVIIVRLPEDVAEAISKGCYSHR